MEGMDRYGGPAPADHLLKYDHPQVITKRFAVPPPRKAPKKSVTDKVIENDEYNIILPLPQKPDKKEPKNPNILDIHSAEDILDYILPPRTWIDNGLQYVQRASRIPSTRMDVLNLQERLDNRLEQLQARETGICPIRRELYSQAFDELIRQATLECAERGLMLLRVRDEIRMSILAYQTLFESSMAYGMRKVLLSEQGKSECSSKITSFTNRNVELQRQVDEWQSKYESLEKQNEEIRQQDKQRKEDELAAVERTNDQLSTVLNNIIVQRTLVFNTGSDSSEIAAPSTPRKKKGDQDAAEAISKTETAPEAGKSRH